MKIFNAKEIFEIAINIEENGIRFYRYAADNIAEDKEVKDMFNELAEQEVEHKGTFSKMLSGITDEGELEDYSEDYFDYLSAYINNTIFSDEMMEEEVSEIKDVTSALEFGIRRELDSILYYNEIKDYVPEKQHEQIEKIIEEERKHYMQLSDLKEEYGD